MYSRMLYHLLLSYLLYLSVYASPTQYSPRDVSKTHFPSLEKALSGVLVLNPATIIGTIASGAESINAHIIGGNLETVKGFSGPQLTAIVDHGDEWALLDNDGKRVRMDGRALIKAANGDFLSFRYTGILELTPEVLAFVAGTVSTIPPASIVISARFETGSAMYKEFENSIFVGTGRLLVHNNPNVKIEYALSKVVV